MFALVDIPPYTFLGIYTGLALSAADALAVEGEPAPHRGAKATLGQ